MQEAAGNGADRAVAYGQAVELGGRHDAVGRAGEKGLVRGVDVIGLEVRFLRGNVQSRGQFQRRLAADAGQGAACVGRLQAAVSPDEEVAALVLGYIAFGIQI